MPSQSTPIARSIKVILNGITTSPDNNITKPQKTDAVQIENLHSICFLFDLCYQNFIAL